MINKQFTKSQIPNSLLKSHVSRLTSHNYTIKQIPNPKFQIKLNIQLSIKEFLKKIKFLACCICLPHLVSAIGLTIRVYKHPQASVVFISFQLSVLCSLLSVVGFFYPLFYSTISSIPAFSALYFIFSINS